MTSGLDNFAQDPTTGLHVPIISRRQVLPYDDVDALGWGSTPAQISPDLLSAFAVLVGQSGQQGKLIHSTKYGFLQTASQVNYTAKAAGSAIVGATTIRIDDPVFGASDTPISILPSPANPNPTHGPYFVNAQADPHLLDLNTGLVVPVVAGDVIMAIAQTQLFGTSSQIHTLTKLVQTALGVVNPFDQDVMATTTINGHRRLATDTARSVDWQQSAVNVTPGAASVTQGAVGAGFRVVVKDLLWTVDNRGGAGIIVGLRVWNGASGVGPLIFFTAMNVPANSIEKLFMPNLLVKASDNTQLVADYSGGAANVNESIFMTGYVEG